MIWKENNFFFYGNKANFGKITGGLVAREEAYEPKLVSRKYLNTYIYNIISHYNLSVWSTAKLLTALMLCVLILYVNDGTYRLTSTLNDRFLRV